MSSRIKFTVGFLIAMVFMSITGYAFYTSNLRNLAITLSTVDNSVIGATTPANVTATNLAATHGLTNNAGFQTFRGTSCTTPASTNGSCNTTVTWPVSMGNTNYTVTCNLSDVSSPGAAQNYGVGSKTATTFVAGIINTPGNTSAVNGTLNCIGIHDQF